MYFHSLYFIPHFFFEKNIFLNVIPLTVSFFSMGAVTSMSPNVSWKMAAILRCWGSEQWSSIDKITG